MINREERLVVAAVVTVVLAFLMLTGCERRELYVYGDEFHDVYLETDWRHYTGHRPDGMTCWFYPDDTQRRRVQRHTTAEVSHYDLYLSGGRWQGMLIDYSPEEYVAQRFDGMDRFDSARVGALPAKEQPELFDSVYAKLEVKTDSIDYTRLYGDSCWYYHDRLTSREPSGYYTVTGEPEYMVLDTLRDMDIYQGQYGDYIPWHESEHARSRS